MPGEKDGEELQACSRTSVLLYSPVLGAWGES